MTDIINYREATVLGWMDTIALSFQGATLIAARDNTLTTRVVTSYVGADLTLDSVAGLYVGSAVLLSVLSGTKPPELTEGYKLLVKSLTGNTITVCEGHDIEAPAILFSAATVSIGVTEVLLGVIHPKAAWDYYAIQLSQSGIPVMSVPLTVTQSWVGGTQAAVSLSTAGFTRGLSAPSPTVVSAWGIVGSGGQIIGAIQLSPTLTISSSQQVTFEHDLLSQTVEIEP